MCRLSETNEVQVCSRLNRRYTFHMTPYTNWNFQITVCEPLCIKFNCESNCNGLRNRQIIQTLVNVVKAITLRRGRGKFLLTAVHYRDYILRHLNTILPLNGIHNLNLRVLYRGNSLQIFVEFRPHELSPNFTFVEIYAQKLNSIKTLEDLALLAVSQIANYKSFYIDTCYQELLMPKLIYLKLIPYLDRKFPESCPYHGPSFFYSICTHCHLTHVHPLEYIGRFEPNLYRVEANTTRFDENNINYYEC